MMERKKCVMCFEIATRVAEENVEHLCVRCYLNNSEVRHQKEIRNMDKVDNSK